MQNPSESQHSADSNSQSTHFGFQTVPEGEKARKVAEVFHSVAQRYDVMNDFMSAGRSGSSKSRLAAATR